MPDTHFKIVFDGKLLPDVSLETAKDNLARLFKSDRQRIDMLFKGPAVTLKRGLADTEADKYLNALGKAGVSVRKEPDLVASLKLVEIDDPQSGVDAPRMNCPKCGHEQARAATCNACGVVVEKFLARPPELMKSPTSESAPSPYTPPQAAVGEPLQVYGELEVFNVQGRIGRLRYLAWSLVMVAGITGLFGLGAMGYAMSALIGSMLIALIGLAAMVISALIGIQRLHDIGWSGWLLLLTFVPVVGGIFALLMVFIPGSNGVNRFGPPPPPNSTAVKVLSLLWLAVPVVGVLVAIALPAYQDYLNRSGL